MAFLFVDRILEFEPGKRARGQFTVPKDVPFLLPSLAGEAVGQLAAWIGMQASGWQSRPVAGLAGEIRARGAIPAGASLLLEASIDSLSAEAMSYRGSASMDGPAILEMRHCVGPMLPMPDFDEPEAARSRFEEIVAGHATRSYDSLTVPAFARETLLREEGRRLVQRLHVPASARFFSDHFPRKPVLPASLLIAEQIAMAGEFGALAFGSAIEEGSAFRVVVRHMKVRAFTSPGAVLDLESESVSWGATGGELRVTALSEGRPISSARLQLALRAAS